MSSLKPFTKPVSILTLGLVVLSAPAFADDSSLHGVQSIDVSLSGPPPQITVRNVAGNHQLANLQLAVQENNVPVGIGGYVDCKGTVEENLTTRTGFFLSGGAFGIGRTSLLLSEDLPDSSNIDHVSDMDAHTFQMPVDLLANPQIAIDPIAVVLAAADKAPSKIDYLRQDHTITVKFPIRWEANCPYYIRKKVTKKTIIESDGDGLSYLTRDVELKIKYEGDPQLFALNAQIAQGGGLPDQVQGTPPPFKITEMNFQPAMPHHVGACPGTTTIRVYYKGQGTGALRIRINDGGTTIHNSPAIAFDAADGQQHYDFEIDVPETDINKTVGHSLQVHYRGKDEKAQTWPSTYQPMDTALWKHRCTPQLNPALSGPPGGQKLGGYQFGNGRGDTPGGAGRAIAPAKPQPVTPKRLLAPSDGDPARPARKAVQ